MPSKILIVEDNAATAGSLVRGLAAAGFEVRSTGDGNDALHSLAANAFDLIVLDWMLPGASGIDIIKWVRRHRGEQIPLLLLTARDALEDRVQGLEAGADDYLVKPFAFAELLARVRTLLRRAAPAKPWQRRIGDLHIDMETRQARRGSRQLVLTPREFDLLAYLAVRQGEVVSREQFTRDVWRETNRATPLDNVLDVHMTRLRHKLDEGGPARLLHTVRGIGYVLREEGVS